MAPADDPAAAEYLLSRFRRLITEVRGGVARRNNFEAWEIDILLDLLQYRLSRSRWARIFQRYQRAMERQLEETGALPLTLSQFLALQTLKKSLRSKPVPKQHAKSKPRAGP